VVTLVEQLGDSTIVYVTIKGFDKEMAVRMNGSIHTIHVGNEIQLGCATEHIRLFDNEGNAINWAA
jgi:ABC-type sugar transport system ATPase subunit